MFGRGWGKKTFQEKMQTPLLQKQLYISNDLAEVKLMCMKSQLSLVVKKKREINVQWTRYLTH